MEQVLTPENLVRRTIDMGDGRILNFYNLPGEDQPINADAERDQTADRDSNAAGKESPSNV
jgi:hypothetical protein